MATLAASFKQVSGVVRSDRPLSDGQIIKAAPSVFAESAHESRSARYAYIPTSDVLNGLRREGFQPFMACQARTRTEGKQEFTKHMLRLRHQSQINGDTANEIILVNSHDGSSSYQMLAGCYRFVCENGLICGDTVGTSASGIRATWSATSSKGPSGCWTSSSRWTRPKGSCRASR